MHKKAILYSIEDISIWKLKELEELSLDKAKMNNFLNYCKKYGIKWLYGDEIFLKKTKPVPQVLYYIGNYNLIKNKKAVWIVWPRKMTDFIKNCLEYVFQKIASSSNIVIVSWLAEWTDQYAHKLSLKYNVPTIWVLWYGIAKWLNWKQRYLIEDIVKNNWLIISQFPLKQPWTVWSFPVRNKIIAGLSDILFVPQAEEKSWSLITVQESIKIDNPVYSCFSSIQDNMWKGTNKLIAESKINWVYDLDLFTKELKDKYSVKDSKHNFTELSEKEQLVCESIKKWYDNIESICFYTKKSTDEVLNILSMLELEWIISYDWERYLIY